MGVDDLIFNSKTTGDCRALPGERLSLRKWILTLLKQTLIFKTLLKIKLIFVVLQFIKLWNCCLIDAIVFAVFVLPASDGSSKRPQTRTELESSLTLTNGPHENQVVTFACRNVVGKCSG